MSASGVRAKKKAKGWAKGKTQDRGPPVVRRQKLKLLPFMLIWMN